MFAGRFVPTSLRGLGGFALMLGLACGRPGADPWAARVTEAQARHLAALPESDRELYAAGFRDGAAMVNQARKVGLRPYRPLVGHDPAPLAWRSPLPEGLVAQAADPLPELDPETGLLAYPANAAPGEAYGRGQADGFTWALGAVGASLVHPLPPPSLPHAWTPWESLQEGVLVNDGETSARLFWSPGRMAWSWQERGFPAQRSWRPWGAPEAPAWAGLRDHTLWIELRGGRALALDPSTGGILQVRAAIPHARPAKTDYQRALDEDQAEWGDPNYQEALRRLEEKAASGALEDLLAALEHLRSMGPEAERRAFPWLLKAAETGHPRSMVQVGVAYFHGVVVKADPGAAERWLDRAARAGDPQAAEVKALLSQSPR